jgi:hypothetical protein
MSHFERDRHGKWSDPLKDPAIGGIHDKTVRSHAHFTSNLQVNYHESCGEEMIPNILTLVCQDDFTLPLIAYRKEE